MKKRLLSLLTAAMLCLGLVSLAACSDEEAGLMDTAVDAVMSEVTDYVAAQTFIDDLEQAFLEDLGLAQYGLDAAKHIASLLKEFDYTVNDISLADGTVTIDVTFTCISLADIETEMADNTENILLAAANLSASQAEAAFDEAFADAVAACEPVQTNHVITYDLLNGTWNIDGGILESAMLNALMG